MNILDAVVMRVEDAKDDISFKLFAKTEAKASAKAAKEAAKHAAAIVKAGAKAGYKATKKQAGYVKEDTITMWDCVKALHTVTKIVIGVAVVALVAVGFVIGRKR